MALRGTRSRAKFAADGAGAARAPRIKDRESTSSERSINRPGDLVPRARFFSQNSRERKNDFSTFNRPIRTDSDTEREARPALPTSGGSRDREGTTVSNLEFGSSRPRSVRRHDSHCSRATLLNRYERMEERTLRSIRRGRRGRTLMDPAEFSRASKGTPPARLADEPKTAPRVEERARRTDSG